MFGLITRKDLFLHPVTVCRDYGWRVLVVGLFLRRGTFLDLVARHAPQQVAHEPATSPRGWPGLARIDVADCREFDRRE
jgi:hypothetical protein